MVNFDLSTIARMQHQTLTDLVNRLSILGEKMCVALEEGDLEGFAACLQIRAGLLVLLDDPAMKDAYRQNPGIAGEASLLFEQDRFIDAALQRYESSLSRQLQDLQRFGKARARYDETPAHAGLLQSGLQA
jgi:hypothetical protein